MPGNSWIDEFELEIEVSVDDFSTPSSTPYLYIHASTSMSSSPPTASLHTFYLPKNIYF
jgi:hypothetical protein